MNSIDHRAKGLGPPRGHAVAWQIARHEIQQSGEGTGPGKPQDHDGRDIVDGAKRFPEERPDRR